MEAGRALSHFLLVSHLLIAPTTFAMQALDDQALSEVAGQALFYTQYTAPNTAQTETDFGFYRIGIEATMEMNANIKALRLGCDGPSGTGACDISIDNLSLSGDAANRNARVGSDAVITNPFFEVAIKNPDSASTREIAGVRFGAASILGLLTAGENGLTANGINTLSGYLQVAATTGTAMTQAGKFGGNGVGGTVTDSGGNEVLNGKLEANILFCTSGCQGAPNYNSFTTRPATSVGLTIPSMAVNFTVPQTTVVGNRLSSVVVNNVLADVPTINITPASGSLDTQINTTICVAFFICVSDTELSLNTSISGIKTNITFNEALGFIHKIPLSGTGGYLSVQKQSVKWPGSNSDDIAEEGWWMSFKDPVQLGVLNPSTQVNISSAYPQIATFLSNYLSQNANRTVINTNDGLSALDGSLTKTVPPIVLTNATAFLTLNNLPLDANQNVVPNCYGTLTFC